MEGEGMCRTKAELKGIKKKTKQTLGRMGKGGQHGGGGLAFKCTNWVGTTGEMLIYD